MTTETLSQAIARVLEMDQQRTPGTWENGCHPANERLNIVKPIMFGKYVGKLPDCEGGAVYFLHRPNAEFIAYAPTMARIIERQTEMLKVAREALEACRDQTPRENPIREGFFTRYQPNPLYTSIINAIAAIDSDELAVINKAIGKETV